MQKALPTCRDAAPEGRRDKPTWGSLRNAAQELNWIDNALQRVLRKQALCLSNARGNRAQRGEFAARAQTHSLRKHNTSVSKAVKQPRTWAQDKQRRARAN
jgi:hypothetical protein